MTSHQVDPIRRELLHLIALGGIASVIGCVPQSVSRREPDLVWGKRGFGEGRFQKARAITISPNDQLYIVDKMGRIQVFDADGRYLRGWNTPAITQGKPTGLGWSKDDRLLVADTHYFRMLVYTPQGELESDRTIGGQLGSQPGQFAFVTDVAQDHRGHFLIGEYGQNDRIQEFDSDGGFLRQWGVQGNLPGQFSRPQGLAVDSAGHLWVADACNHRVQVFDLSGPKVQLLRIWGSQGDQAGQLHTPYAVLIDRDDTVLICEYGNHRVQRFSVDGKSLEMLGGHGRGPGSFLHPWGIALDSQRRLHVLDTENFRVQRFRV